MEQLLEIDDLVVAFETPSGEMTAVKNVSLHLAAGETLALVGESGCGKTVLCKSMLQILCQRGRVRKGQILLQGRDLTSLSEAEMQRCRGGEVAMVFQDPMTALDPAFSVGAQIAEALRLHQGLAGKEARRRAVELMERVRIDDAADRYHQKPWQFSGGMRQRIVIAIALTGNPRLLLADEPTTALDEPTQREILHLLKEIQQEREIAILFITHDLSLVEEMAGRVAIMKEGRILEEGTVAEVFASPQHEETKKLLRYLDYRKGRGHHHRRPAAGGSCARGEQPLLSVQHLEKSYRLGKQKIPVLRDFSLTVYEGEIVGLVGPSGCGKSTLARCIMGIERPERGEISLRREAEAQMIFQEVSSAFNDRMTVAEIITEPLRIRGSSGREDAAQCSMPKDQTGAAGRRAIRQAQQDALLQVMKQVELDPALAHRRPYQLSGGQRQRVAIARALITNPGFIVADEPLTGLDVTAQAQIVHLFRRLAEERDLTILLIAHDLPMVNHVSNRVIRMGEA